MKHPAKILLRVTRRSAVHFHFAYMKWSCLNTTSSPPVCFHYHRDSDRVLYNSHTSMSISSTGLIVLLTFWVLFYLQIRPVKKHGRFPPGPPKKFVIGNMLDLKPNGHTHWKIFTEWKKSYGTLPLRSILIV